MLILHYFLQQQMEFQTLTLPNGIRVVHKRVKSPVAYCGLTVNAGTRDELESEHGMAHFLEHVLFKGTTKRSSLRISSFLENEGGDLNAFTTKEETAIHAVVLKNDVSKAFDIISDKRSCCRVQRNLPGCKEQVSDAVCLRIRPDRGRCLIGVDDCSVHVD